MVPIKEKFNVQFDKQLRKFKCSQLMDMLGKEFHFSIICICFNYEPSHERNDFLFLIFGSKTHCYHII